jgi:hypothetical protein
MDERKMIEVTEPKGFKVGTVRYYKGETCSFPVEEADKYISLGWAKCATTGQTGDRVPGAVKLDAVINRVVPAAAPAGK